jgi:acetylserotonin N-methyltransferase
MEHSGSLPDPALVLELAEAFRRSKVMFAALNLGVFDQLARGPAGVQDLASRIGAAPDALERLLDACAGLGLLHRNGNHYSNSTVAGAYLCQESPHRVTGYLNYSNDVLWKLWAHLEDAVREGSHRWQQAYGWDGPIFSHFFKNESLKREFLMGMHGYGLLSSPHVVEAFDLSSFQVLADLGGATGHLVMAACRRYPRLRGVVFDLPEAVPLAREIVSASGFADRIAVQGGDFFSDPLPKADLYALGRILHDWAPEKINRLLVRVYEALPRGGAVLIAEKLLHDDKLGPRWAHMQSLNMLVCTEGKERTVGEYADLLRGAGFTDVRGSTTPSPLDAVLARKT